MIRTILAELNYRRFKRITKQTHSDDDDDANLPEKISPILMSEALDQNTTSSVATRSRLSNKKRK